MAGKNKQLSSTTDIRASLEVDVEAFLKKGNKIQQIPSGVSGQVSVSAKKAPVADKKAPDAEKPADEPTEPVAEQKTT